jgi:K+-transporting ATPase ATPase A chain
MTIAGFAEIAVTLALVLAAAVPLGRLMADVFEGRRTFLHPVLSPVERAVYRLAAIDPQVEQAWASFTVSMLIFTAVCLLGLFALLLLQGVLPLNPQGFAGVDPILAFNIAISFVTNANWQAYGGEMTLSHLSQMVGLTTQNFLDTAVATGVALALIRAFARHESETVGNFWVDVTRTTLYVLVPLCLIVSLAFVTLGVPQTLTSAVAVATLEGVKQILSIGPVASQEAIKLIGDNGGGFFNANSAHPFENPSAISNMLQNWSQLVLPAGFVFAFARMVGDTRQARALLATIAVLFLAMLLVFYGSETRGVPALTALGVDPAQGLMEGKDLRFGQAGAALFVDATTGTGTGASNAVLDSMAPLSGLAAMFNLLMGCISPGGLGTGLYSLLLYAVLAAFFAGLMVGRTPDFLGKKIDWREMRLATVAILIAPAVLLGFAGVAVRLQTALDSLGTTGPHGLSEIVYAYASSVADNGSSFAGLTANTPWFNITTGIAMLLGRIAHAIPILAIAGSLAAKKKLALSAGTLPTSGPLFTSFLLGVIVVIALLQYLPAVALGPIAEHFQYARGAVF